MLKKILLSLLLFAAVLNATTPTQENVTTLYVAMFDRAPDSGGLDYWVKDSTLDLEGIAWSFFEQEETQLKYPPGTTEEEFITAVFTNLFNRLPDAAGLKYWKQELEAGNIPRSLFVLAVINGALGDDAMILENKTEVGLYFAQSALNSAEWAREVMANVTADSQSVYEAKRLIDKFVDLPENALPVARGGIFFGVAEHFNRYFTDKNFHPSHILYVSPYGKGSGSNNDPMSVEDAIMSVSAGMEIRFLAGEYSGCWELDRDSSGTYNDPIVIKADPNVTIHCCNSGRKTCFNLEYADYVAIDGFHLLGGDYGIRAVGGYAVSEHQKGIAILNNHGEYQHRDPFFSGGSDWIIIANNIANGAGEGDGHGIYLSNGGDWMIIHGNELYGNSSSDLQINADPISTCEDEGISYSDPRCDGSALDGLGRGVSEFVLFENNYLHNNKIGPNFTSVRNSHVRNNIIGFYERHNTSFWQETGNPKLGSSNNIIEHNLFIGENSNHVLQFINHSANNTVRNNVLLGITLFSGSAGVNSDTLLIEQDKTTEDMNTFKGNYYVGGYFEYYSPNSENYRNSSFSANWFENFPFDRIGSIYSFRPTLQTPFVGLGKLQMSCNIDMEGKARRDPTTPGPWSSAGGK